MTTSRWNTKRFFKAGDLVRYVSSDVNFGEFVMLPNLSHRIVVLDKLFTLLSGPMSSRVVTEIYDRSGYFTPMGRNITLKGPAYVSIDFNGNVGFVFMPITHVLEGRWKLEGRL